LAVVALCTAVIGLPPFAGAAAQPSNQFAQAARPLVWPPPPEAPRVAYVQSIARPADIGVKRSFFGSIGKWITGSDTATELFLRPFGVAFDESDNLCLTDSAANAVCHFERSKRKWVRWETVGKLRFISPVAVARIRGIFFAADSGLGAVVAFDDKGKLLFQITNKLERPAGLVVSGQRLFVVDSLRHCVVAYDLGGHYLFEFGRRGSDPAEFNFPTHIAADTSGDLYVTDSMNNRVVRLDQEGRFKNQIGGLGDGPGHFGRPKGVALDTLGHVYVLDALFDNIQIFDPEGQFLLALGGTGPEPGQFWLPNGIAINRQNEIFVADAYNRRVQVFKYVGQP
jgi:sugar lactone lactonase YvrE